MLICSSNSQAVNNYSISSLAKIKISKTRERPAQQEKIILTGIMLGLYKVILKALNRKVLEISPFI